MTLVKKKYIYIYYLDEDKCVIVQKILISNVDDTYATPTKYVSSTEKEHNRLDFT